MPNQGVPVIFKNKIAYGYAEKSVQAYDVSVSDYNALTEQQQLDGSIRFIQGVDAIPNGSNVWAKLGTTPLAEGLPRDCSQAVNQLKSNLTQLLDVENVTTPSTSKNYTLIKNPKFAVAFGTNLVTATFSSGSAHCYIEVPTIDGYTFSSFSISQGVPSTPNSYLKYCTKGTDQIEFYIGGGPSSGTGYPPISIVAYYIKTTT